jgi:hypothetical protein
MRGVVSWTMTNIDENATRGSTAKDIGAVVSALTLLGLALYGLDYTTLINFYEAFGLSPTDVGITYADALGRSAAGFLVLTFLLLPLLTLLALMFAWLIRRILRGVTDYGGLNRRVWERSYTLAITLFACLFWIFNLPVSALIRLILAILTVGIHAIAVKWLANQVRRVRNPKPAIDLSFGAIVLLGWAIFAAIALPLWAVGAVRGTELASTGDPSPFESGINLFVFGAIPCVQLTWTSSESIPSSFPKNEVLYLGEKTGMIVIADVNSIKLPAPHIQRIPLSKIVVTRAEALECEAK